MAAQHAEEKGGQQNAKNALQEHCLRCRLQLPAYDLEKREGLDHAPTFTVQAHCLDKVAHGVGATRREAEMRAAEELCGQLGVRCISQKKSASGPLPAAPPPPPLPTAITFAAGNAVYIDANVDTAARKYTISITGHQVLEDPDPANIVTIIQNAVGQAGNALHDTLFLEYKTATDYYRARCAVYVSLLHSGWEMRYNPWQSRDDKVAEIWQHKCN